MVQFHTFFLQNGVIRFSKEEIDFVCSDVRYPDDFFVELVVDEERTENLNKFDSKVSGWKNLMSDFFIKSLEVKAEENKDEVNEELKAEELKAEERKERKESGEDEDLDDYLKDLEEREV